MFTDFKQECAQQPGTSECSHQPDAQANPDEHPRLSQYQTYDVTDLSAQRHAHANFFGAPTDCVRDHTIYSDRRQKHRYGGKRSKDIQTESLRSNGCINSIL